MACPHTEQKSLLATESPGRPVRDNPTRCEQPWEGARQSRSQPREGRAEQGKPFVKMFPPKAGVLLASQE